MHFLGRTSARLEARHQQVHKVLTSPDTSPVIRRCFRTILVDLRLLPDIEVSIWIILSLLRLQEPVMLLENQNPLEL